MQVTLSARPGKVSGPTHDAFYKDFLSQDGGGSRNFYITFQLQQLIYLTQLLQQYNTKTSVFWIRG